MESAPYEMQVYVKCKWNMWNASDMYEVQF